MKAITPIQFTEVEVMSTKLKVTIVEDDLEAFARFSWWLFTEEGIPVDTGIVHCDGETYMGWDGNNTFPYTHVASNKGLEIITV